MALWLASAPLMLASRSAARRSLLEAAGVPVELFPADIDERGVEAQARLHDPVAIAGLLAREKAAFVAKRHPGRLVLGADQTLAFADQRFSKPANRSAARAQLKELAGRTHALHAAVAFVQDGAVLFEHVETARMTMRAFSDDFLDRYLEAAGGAASASVGGYQLESVGVQLFERVDGDYFTILGLPLLHALDFLRRRGCLAR
jgi:septum formation protein